MTSYKEVWNAVMNLNKCEFIILFGTLTPGRHCVCIFFGKPNGFPKKIQTLYIVNLYVFWESYGKKS